MKKNYLLKIIRKKNHIKSNYLDHNREIKIKLIQQNNSNHDKKINYFSYFSPENQRNIISLCSNIIPLIKKLHHKNTEVFEVINHSNISKNLDYFQYDVQKYLKLSNNFKTSKQLIFNNKKNIIKSNNSFYQGLNISHKNFSLYIPYKKLSFINHAKFGSVYPVYIADTEHYLKNNPKKIMPLLSFFTCINLFVCLSGFQIIPMTKLYDFLFVSDTSVFFSVLFNVYLMKKYIDSLIKYRNRVKNLFLMPSGMQIIIESFDGNKNHVDIQDIFERRVYLRYEGTQKNSVFTNNDNSFRANIGWGFNKENFFEGKRKFLDYEILHQIIHRNNIDTSQIKFKSPEVSLNFLTSEEKRSLLQKFFGRKILEKFNFNNLKLSYFYLKKKIFKGKNSILSRKDNKLIGKRSNNNINLKNSEAIVELKIHKEKNKLKILSFYD